MRITYPRLPGDLRGRAWPARKGPCRHHQAVADCQSLPSTGSRPEFLGGDPGFWGSPAIHDVTSRVRWLRWLGPRRRRGRPRFMVGAGLPQKESASSRPNSARSAEPASTVKNRPLGVAAIRPAGWRNVTRASKGREAARQSRSAVGRLAAPPDREIADAESPSGRKSRIKASRALSRTYGYGCQFPV